MHIYLCVCREKKLAYVYLKNKIIEKFSLHFF